MNNILATLYGSEATESAAGIAFSHPYLRDLMHPKIFEALYCLLALLALQDFAKTWGHRSNVLATDFRNFLRGGKTIK